MEVSGRIVFGRAEQCMTFAQILGPEVDSLNCPRQ